MQIHGAGPDASPGIGFRVVHPIARQVWFRIVDGLAPDRVEREFVEATLKAGDETRPMASLEHPTNFFGHWPGRDSSAAQRIAMQRMGQNVDPVDGVVTRGPQRAFTQLTA